MDGWRSIYSAAPLLPWLLMRNIARDAGVHIYDDAGDMLWGNNAFLAIYAQHDGTRMLRFPKPISVTDAYTDQVLGINITALDLDLAQGETKLLFLSQKIRQYHLAI